jgi:predicted nucleotidyltransferase
VGIAYYKDATYLANLQSYRKGLLGISFSNPYIFFNFTVMLTLQNILQILRQHKPELQRKYPISRLGVFGSYARGEATEKSDIDIAVELNGPMGLNFVAMADEIEELFGIKTDVVPKRSIKPKYLPYVEKDIVYV